MSFGFCDICRIAQTSGNIAVIDLLCAEGLKGSENLNLQDTLNTLNQWTAYVKYEIDRNFHRFKEHPEESHNSLGEYRMGMLITVVQKDLNVRYNPERATPQLRHEWEENDVFFADSKDVFIHGLLSTNHTGTCSSMPVLYAAIHLVKLIIW